MCSLNVTNVLDESGWNVFLMVLRESFIWDWLITRSARNAVQSVHGHILKRPPHQRMLLQDLVETVRAQRVKTAVGLSPHAGCASSLCQQANLPKICSIVELNLLTTTWEDGDGAVLDKVHFPTQRSLSYNKISWLEDFETQLGQDHRHKMRVSVGKQWHIGYESTTVIADNLLLEWVTELSEDVVLIKHLALESLLIVIVDPLS